MEITLNGQTKTLAKTTSLHDLLRELQLLEARLAVAINRSIVPRSRFVETALTEGDVVELIHAVGGG